MGFYETVEKIDKETENEQDSEHDPFTPLNELIGNASTNTPSTQIGKKGRKRARRADLLIDVISDLVKQICALHASTGKNIRRLIDCYQFEADGIARRMKVFDKLKNIDGLPNDEQVRVGQLLVQNQVNTNLFFTLDDEFKLGFLIQLLD
ncbi:hypothetical protein TorRG33x02_067270 [Trema orientale]|uniref:Uncharacterized protein n=1 Tax=Trema orientale TaxID=63057 RepID=A0A2P5FI93_TREOI|nr:hypothetical protein TorRG33x02_067270 [Trema orientale]